MKTAHASLSTIALVLGCSALPAHATSVYLSPSAQMAPLSAGTASFTLMMDFAANDATLGGGIDLDVSGNAAFASFLPSSFFTTVADPAFSGFGTMHADNDYEIHFGNFNGLSGLNNLGTVTLTLTAPGSAQVNLAINSFFGDFYSAVTFNKQGVALSGAALTITAVPEPQTVMTMLAGLGLGLIGFAARASRKAA